MPPLRGKGECYIHSPGSARQRSASRSKAGQRVRVPNAKAPVDVMLVADLQRHLGQALADALQHENSLKRAAVVARLLMAGLQMIAAGETEMRLQLVEERLQRWEEQR